MQTYRVRERLHENLLDHLLLARGVEPAEQAAFLQPDFARDSHDPFLLPGMGVAVERILAALKKGEKVAVWSDYDCDGIPGGVLLTEFFRAMGLQVTHYIPHRHKEGYGLNQEGLDELAAAGNTLLVTVDLGTTEVDNIAYAKQKGFDVIVTDHHLEPAVLPDALAIINPKLSTSQYPFGDLCGSGVAWKLVQALLTKDRPSGYTEGREKWLLDLVALGTLSDMVPLVGENRMLAHFGLTVLRRGRRPGLSALLDLLRIKPAALTEDDIGFMVAPRINAASRMDSPQLAAQLLAATDPAEATLLARQLNKINDERKGLVAATVKEVNKRLLGQDLTLSPIIVMGSPHWRPGVLGLVANKLAEAHGKSVWLWGRDGSTGSPQEGALLRGSCRAARGVNIVELMAAAGDGVFDHYGGHAASGGFALTEEKVHVLPARLAAAYEAVRAQEAPTEEVWVDRELSLAEVGHAHQALKQLAPFGVGNTKPLFIFPRVPVASMRMFGKQQDHLEIMLGEEYHTISGISFFFTPESFSKKPELGGRADIVGHVETDWRGRPRIRVVDII